MEKTGKKLERIDSTLDFLSNKLRFNEVHANSYRDKQGKIKYKGRFRVYNREITFEDVTLTDLDNLLEGILIGYLFCMVKNEYKK